MIVDGHPIGQTGRHVPGMPQLCQIQTPRILQRNFGQDGHTIISFLTTRHHVGIAQVCKTRGWDQLNRAFALLQTQDIRRLLAEQLQNNRLA